MNDIEISNLMENILKEEKNELPKERRLFVRVNKDIKRELKRFASEEGITLTQLILRGLYCYIDYVHFCKYRRNGLENIKY